MEKQRLHKILVTRPLSDEQIAHAQALQLDPLIVPALSVEFPENWDKIIRKLDNHPETPWVFTSQNGVEALGRLLAAGYRIHKTRVVYAVGEKTAGVLSELGIEAKVPEQQDAEGLVERIKKESVQSTVIHWCGNRSRPALEEGLAKAGIDLIRVVVYETQLNVIKLPETTFEAILFYSPSAVEAFCRSVGFSENLPDLFAIGKTTGESLSMESGKNVHIPSMPSTESLLKLVAWTLGITGSERVTLRRGIKGD